MLSRTGKLLIIGGVTLLLLLMGARAAAQFYTELLWFESLEQLSVFWTRFGIHVVARSVAGILAAALVLLNLWLALRHFGSVFIRRRYGNLEIAEQVPRKYIWAGMAVTAVLTGLWLSSLKFGGGGSLLVAAWWNRVEWGVVDPFFQRDVAFYVFSLPFFHQVLDYLLMIGFTVLVLVVIGYYMVGVVRLAENRVEINETARLHLVVLGAVFLLVLAVRFWLGRYSLMLDGNGIAGSLGYTDVIARIPAYRLIAILAAVLAGSLIYGAWRRNWVPPMAAGATLIIGAIAAMSVFPSIIQRFRVDPNQLARESTYIQWHMDYTRQAYGLDGLERRSFPYRRGDMPAWQELKPTLSRLPLWDPEPLRTTLLQLQSIFPYYHFPQVTFDRYRTSEGLQQVALAVREFQPSGLDESARTWQTLRLNPVYHRGPGVVVVPAAQSDRGEPMLWISEINPVRRSAAAPEELDILDPNIYIGHSMRHYVVLIPGYKGELDGQVGRDFPRGIQLSSLPRILAVAWRFSDKNLIFSGEITSSSHFLFRRTVHERVQTLAPFILWDSDPYPVLADGRVVWIVDGYTATGNYPLSRATTLQGAGRVRYVRNSVKATVDAVSGNVAMYVADDEDPLLATYRSIFPDLFAPLREMPLELAQHLRYPAVYINTQAEILQEYHLRRPEAFYAGEDYWQLPQLPGRGLRLPYGATYAVLQLPGHDASEFLSVLPFIARQRLNMTALLVGRNDLPNYGELILLELPRDQRISGPTQVRTLIEQDPVISAQLTLWRQGGSDVESGRLRLVPLDSSFLYVEPLFHSAQGNPIPELWRVIVSDGRSVIMAETLHEAVEALGNGAAVPSEAPAVTPLPLLEDMDRWPQRALDLLEQADRHLRAGDFAGFGDAWSELRELLRRLSGPSG